MKHCSKCTVEYADDIVFCPHCGDKLIEGNLQYSCPNCGRILGSSYEDFCPHCGYQLGVVQNPVAKNNKSPAKNYIVIASIIVVLFGGYWGFKQNLINAGYITPSSAKEAYEYSLHLSKNGNESLAWEWTKIAADKGHQFSKFLIGGCYLKGAKIFEKNETLGFELVKEAGLNGVVEAQYLLAWMYREGSYVKQDYDVAITWATEAHKKGYAEATHFIAKAYLDGKGLEQSDEKAYEYCKEAADNGSLYAKIDLIRYKNDRFSKFMDDKYYIKLLEEVGNANDPFGLFTLGKAYVFGESGVQKDLPKGTELLKKAAQNGMTRAYYVLGMAYIGKPESFTYFKLGAEANDVPSMKELAYCYLLGKGVEKDEELYNYWMKKYRKNGGKTAWDNLTKEQQEKLVKKFANSK